MLTIGNKTFSSRLFTGTGKFSHHRIMAEAIQESGSELATMALKRVDIDNREDDILRPLVNAGVHLLPNTSGARNAREAVFAAQLAREALGTEWVKLEIHPDPKYLMPDPIETLKAAEQLAREGFIVLPYCHADPVLCKRLEEVGCAAVMPLAAPIGSGLGIRNPYNILTIVENASVPILVDAGVGTASDAAIAMELGCDGILMQTAIAGAKNPVLMASAMKKAVEAGREAYRAGRIPRKRYATASSPVDGTFF